MSFFLELSKTTASHFRSLVCICGLWDPYLLQGHCLALPELKNENELGKAACTSPLPPKLQSLLVTMRFNPESAGCLLPKPLNYCRRSSHAYWNHSINAIYHQQLADQPSSVNACHVLAPIGVGGDRRRPKVNKRRTPTFVNVHSNDFKTLRMSALWNAEN